MDLDAAGDVVAVGALGSAGVDFGGGPLGFAPSPSDVVIARYAGATGAHLVSLARGSSGDDVGLGVAIDPRTDNAIMVGHGSGGFDLGDGWGGDSLGGYGVFVADVGRLRP